MSEARLYQSDLHYIINLLYKQKSIKSNNIADALSLLANQQKEVKVTFSSNDR